MRKPGVRQDTRQLRSAVRVGRADQHQPRRRRWTDAAGGDPRPLGRLRAPPNSPSVIDSAKRAYPAPLTGSGTEAAIDAGRVVDFADCSTATAFRRSSREVARRIGRNGSQMFAPLMPAAAASARSPSAGRDARRLQRTRDRAAADLRRPGRHRDPERAAVQRDREAWPRSRSARSTERIARLQTAISDVLRCMRESSDVAPVFAPSSRAPRASSTASFRRSSATTANSCTSSPPRAGRRRRSRTRADSTRRRRTRR